MTITTEQMNDLINAQHPTPHQVFGLQRDHQSGYLTITAMMPSVCSVEIIDKTSKKSLGKLKLVDGKGLYHLKLRRKNRFGYLLKVTQREESQLIEDAFAYPATLGELDIHLLN